MASRLFQRGSLPDAPGLYGKVGLPHLARHALRGHLSLSPGQGQAASLLLPDVALSREGMNPRYPAHGLQRKYQMPKALEGRARHLRASTLSQHGEGPGATAVETESQCCLHPPCSPPTMCMFLSCFRPW